MKRKQKYIVSTTHIDSHGNSMSKQALESMLKFLNGERKPRVGLEHIRTFPPFGATMNGELIQMEGNHFGVTAEMVFFDKQQYMTLSDGTELAKESFSEGTYPFIECSEEEVNKISIVTDPTNFESSKELEEIYSLLREDAKIDFDTSEQFRKSALPDPEIIIKITGLIATAIGIIKLKVGDKLAEAVGEDLAKFYKLLSRLAIETVKRVKPSNRPKHFVIEYPNADCSIELVVTTHIPDRVLTSMTKEKLKVVAEKLEQLENLNPEKIQFIYNDEDTWEFNYLLSKTGAVIGTIKSFNKRNDLYNKMLEAQNKKKNES
jgi:hypothetical protein